MTWFLICLIFCYTVFLYDVYRLGKGDFVLDRKDVPLERLFNFTFITTLMAIFFGRLSYVVFYGNTSYLNPLKFLVIPYYPGLILPGGIVGAFAYLWFIHKGKKVPSGRLIDFYATALLMIMPLVMLSELFLLPNQEYWLQVILAAVYLLVFLLFNYILLPKVGRGEIKDGTIGQIFLAILCVVSFLQDSFLIHKGIFYFLRLEDIFYLLVTFFVLFIVVKREFIPNRRSR